MITVAEVLLDGVETWFFIRAPGPSALEGFREGGGGYSNWE